MSTRSVTEIRSVWGKDQESSLVTVIYRHYDGYLDEHGNWIRNFLDTSIISNGREKGAYNGPGEFASGMAAQLLKDGHHPSLMSEVSNVGQEFHYQITVDMTPSLFSPSCERKYANISITVFDGPVTIFGAGGDRCTNKIFEGRDHEYSEWLDIQLSEKC